MQWLWLFRLRTLLYCVARFGKDGLPSALVEDVQHPAEATRIGGSAPVLAAG